MMSAVDILISIDELVSDALTEFSELTALVPTSMIQVWDRESDVRGNIEAISYGGWVRIVPGPIRSQVDYSSSESRFEIPYAIEYGHMGLKRSDCNQIATAIIRGLMRLHMGLKADGVTPITQPSPFRVEAVLSLGIDRERVPIDDPEGWTDVHDLAVIAFAARTDIVATAPTAVGATGAILEGVALFTVVCDQQMEPREIGPAGWSGVVPGPPNKSVAFTGGSVAGNTITMLATTGLNYAGDAWLSFANPGGDLKGLNGMPLIPFDKLPVVSV